jgi:mono/diheme cytochrome c family protein
LLGRLDRFLAWLTWVAATLVVVMLVTGPAIVAADKDNPPASEAAGASAYASGGGGGKPDGKAVFTGNCGSCHTLKAAGTSGQVGPQLDGISLDAAAIEQTVRKGRGAMPAFEGRLSAAEIRAVAAYVARSR